MVYFNGFVLTIPNPDGLVLTITLLTDSILAGDALE